MLADTIIWMIGVATFMVAMHSVARVPSQQPARVPVRAMRRERFHR